MIAVEDDEPIDSGKGVEAEAYRVPGSPRRVLKHRRRATGKPQRMRQIGGFLADDEHDAVWPCPRPGTEDALDHGHPGDRVKSLGSRGPHTGAGASGEDNESDPFVWRCSDPHGAYAVSLCDWARGVR